MFRIVHKELKYNASVPAGRAVGFYAEEACSNLLTLVDKDGSPVTNPVAMVQGGTVEVFTPDPVRQAWAKSDYPDDVARPVALVPDLGTGGVATFDETATVAQVNAGTFVVVPAVTGKSFYPITAMMRAQGGNAGTATLIRLVEETSSGVVLSHVIADMTSGTWVGRTGGTSVATLLDNLPLVAAKAILLDKTGGALDTCTHVRAVVAGFYV